MVVPIAGAHRLLHRRHALRGRLLRRRRRRRHHRGLRQHRRLRRRFPGARSSRSCSRSSTSCARRLMKLSEASTAFISGFNAMVPAILVLTFAVGAEEHDGPSGRRRAIVAGLMENAAPGPVQPAARRHLPGGAVPGLRLPAPAGAPSASSSPSSMPIFASEPHAADHRHLRLPGGCGVPATIARPSPTPRSWPRPAPTCRLWTT